MNFLENNTEHKNFWKNYTRLFSVPESFHKNFRIFGASELPPKIPYLLSLLEQNLKSLFIGLRPEPDSNLSRLGLTKSLNRAPHAAVGWAINDCDCVPLRPVITRLARCRPLDLDPTARLDFFSRDCTLALSRCHPGPACQTRPLPLAGTRTGASRAQAPRSRAPLRVSVDGVNPPPVSTNPVHRRFVPLPYPSSPRDNTPSLASFPLILPLGAEEEEARICPLLG